ncbi:MAG: HAD family hydrolase [Bacillota bacterium]
MSFKCVAFDVDGTLLDTEKAVLTSLQRVLLEETGKAPAAEQLRFVLGIPGVTALEQLGVPDCDAAFAKWVAYAREYDHLVTVFPGIPEVLDQLQNAGATLGMVTSRTRVELEGDIVHFGLLERFHAVICADDTEGHKPDPDPLLKLMADTGFSPGEVIYVGDTVYDSQCARAAGVKFALALWGAGDPNVPCDYRVAHPAELVEICRPAPGR